MGDYTWFRFNVEFQEGSIAVPVIQHMIDLHREVAAPIILPDHALFKTPRWRTMLVMSSGDHDTCVTEFRYDEDSHRYKLSVDSSFKESNELALFLSWLTPLDDGLDGYRGFYLPAYNQHPVLVYREAGRYVFRFATMQKSAFDADKLSHRAVV